MDGCRYDKARGAFAEVFAKSGAPMGCRAPGRVNLIGEHVDYNGFPVLPMTLDREIVLAYARRSDSLVRMRSPGDVFPAVDFVNTSDIAPSPAGSWENYCKAALQGISTYLEARDYPGMDVLVYGDIPIASGLSSSSALVVACALAYLDVLGQALGGMLTRLRLAEVLAEAEHYVGTRGGGMDQAIILLGRVGAACKINFNPLRTEEVPVFDGHAFVVCNSLVRAQKTGNALDRYNEGPATCRLIRAMVEKQAQRDFGEDVSMSRLADLWFGPLCLTHSEVAELVDRAIPKDTMTLDEVARTVDVSLETLVGLWPGGLREPAGGFRVRARARHQLTEFARVETARDLAQSGDAEGFGHLMDESHASCAADYGVSCPELDKLVDVARGAGSIGSRLTGAGFGGCTVNLVPQERLDGFRTTVMQEYYDGYLGRRAGESGDDPIIVATPVAGATYLPW